MKNLVKLSMCLLVVMMLFSCTTYRGTNDGEQIIGADFEIVGEVEKEFNAVGICGFNVENSMFRFGTHSSYLELLAKAKELGADDVIGIKEDVEESRFMGFATLRTCYARGFAIKYIK